MANWYVPRDDWTGRFWREKKWIFNYYKQIVMLQTGFLGIVIFLIVLAIFDLVVGVSNDAVNFLNSAIGAKVARFRTIVVIAAIGVFAGAALSNGMMDVARHGIMTPMYFSFYDVMCVFLAVMITDIVLLDVFNTLGMPTSTTVSMVFELLGGAFAIALLKIANGARDAQGQLLTLGDLLNTEKAMSVILGIFLSVAIAFLLGTLVQWVARMVFTFTYRTNGTTTDVNGKMGGLASSSIKIGVFGGLSVTLIIWFLLISGLKNSSFMTAEVKQMIQDNTWLILIGGMLLFSTIMTVLSAFKLPVLKFVVLLGTFALAMAFAGNDLVNFVGVPLTGLDAFQDYMRNGNGMPEGYMMESLMNPAQTPILYLIFAGVVMVLSLIFSKKAQNVVKTSVDLSRQDEGDEMFGSSAVARTIVRSSSRMANVVVGWIPAPVRVWIDKRFNSDSAVLRDGAAFDLIRAAVNLVLAGLLVALGTSFKLPLSTTYVTFMVAMGSSLADRAWSRDSAVFRITGVLSVIGGWFITAGVAFILCYLVTNAMFFGRFVVMAILIVVAVVILVRSNRRYAQKQKEEQGDELFISIMRSKDEKENWVKLCQHVRKYIGEELSFVVKKFKEVTDAFFHEEYRPLKHATDSIDEARHRVKRQRRREILALRRIDPILAVERNTWYFLSNNAVEQMLFCMKRTNDPCRDHIGNNFTPVAMEYATPYLSFRDEVVKLYMRTITMLEENNFVQAEAIRNDSQGLQMILSSYRKEVIDDIQKKNLNIESMTVFLNVIQESQELISALRHMIRGVSKFQE